MNGSMPGTSSIRTPCPSRSRRRCRRRSEPSASVDDAVRILRRRLPTSCAVRISAPNRRACAVARCARSAPDDAATETRDSSRCANSSRPDRPGVLFDEQRAQPFRRAIDRRGQPRRPAADDQEVVERQRRASSADRSFRPAPPWSASPDAAIRKQHDRQVRRARATTARPAPASPGRDPRPPTDTGPCCATGIFTAGSTAGTTTSPARACPRTAGARAPSNHDNRSSRTG